MMFLKPYKPGSLSSKRFSRRVKKRSQYYGNTWNCQKLRWGIGLFAKFSGTLSVFEFRCVRSIFKFKFKNTAKISTDLTFSIPKTIKPKASRMGKGLGALNYRVSSIKKNQQIAQIIGLNYSSKLKNQLVIHNKTSVKLFAVKKFIRWVD